MLDLSSPLGQRVTTAQGKCESGQIANMRSYQIRTEIVHVRLVGEAKTLCGRSLHHSGEYAWQFIHRGSIPLGQIPSHLEGRDGCKRCLANKAVKAMFEIADTRRRALRPPYKHTKEATK